VQDERINLTFRKVVDGVYKSLQQLFAKGDDQVHGSQASNACRFCFGSLVSAGSVSPDLASMAWCRNAAVWTALLVFGAPSGSDALKLGINWETGFESSGLQWKSPLPGETQRYLIASFPKDFKISYARLPDPTWRPLIVHNLSNPAVLAVDEQNMRLFVADPTASKVFWYKLKVLPSKFLVTEGLQHVAAESMIAKGMAVSQAGDLFISGRVVASPPLTGHSAIYKQAADALEAAEAPLPKRLWTAGDGSWIPVLNADGAPATSQPMSPSTPEIYQPGPVAVDMFTLYWGNAIKGNASALVRGPQTVPAPLPGGAAAPKSKAGAHALANNLQAVTGLAITSSGIFYAGRPVQGRPGIFALRSEDSLNGCAADDHCVHRVAQVSTPVDMCWDGDATLFIADAGSGAVLSVPSSTASRHAVVKVAEALGVHAITMLTVPSMATKVTGLGVALVSALTSLLSSV